MSNPKKMPTRLERAILIRDFLLPLIRAEGKIQRSGSDASVIWSRPGYCTAFFRTPFTTVASIEEEHRRRTRLISLGLASQPILSYALDVYQDGKVMNLEWDTDGRTVLVSFKAGDWDSVLVARSCEVNS